jgi:2-polyprenyl-3-methyl-5-hydroxy-6-metoxy-1,4-benzoquinol methylase
MDVSGLFNGRSEISIFRSPDSDLRFYGPDSVAGDGPFYEKLQQFPWYYMAWKWEHEALKNRLNHGDQVLELGCGEGAFLQGIKAQCPDSVGLELNEVAVATAQENGLAVYGQSIQEHARMNEGKYDVVCSFQVMEHVTDVKSIVEASITCLKPGGKLYICVPNNDSFIKRSTESLLNMPPHHMNLWDESSLRKLASFFPILYDGYELEPLQPYHYQVVFSNWVFDTFKPRLFAKVLNRFMKVTRLYKLASFWKHRIPGHSIMAIYTKQ